MIPPETPVGSRVRVYRVRGDETTAIMARMVTTVQSDYVTVRRESDEVCQRVFVGNVEPIGAKPFPPLPKKFKCPHCEREFER